MRERLEHEPARLLVDAPSSAGTVTARHWTHDGWKEGTVALAIDSGELQTAADAGGQLSLGTFDLTLAPIDIPPTVFGTPVQLTNIRIALARPPAITTTWSDADDATGNAMIELTLAWSIAVNNNVAPLGAQPLAPMPVTAVLGGGGEHVDATVSLHAHEPLWSWADLFQITGIDLDLQASTD